MGLALRKDIEEVFSTLPKAAVSSSTSDFANTVKAEERALLKKRNLLISFTQETREGTQAALRMDKNTVLGLRGDLVKFQLALIARIQLVGPHIKSLIDDANNMSENLVIANPQSRRHVRQMIKRLVATLEQDAIISNQFVSVISESVALIDAWIRANVKRPASFSEGLADLEKRYPVVTEYLAR